MAFRWRAYDGHLYWYFDHLHVYPLINLEKKNVIKFGIPLIKLFESANENNACIHVINYSLRPINIKTGHPG